MSSRVHTAPAGREIERRSVEVTAEDDGRRLDAVLAARLADMSRAQVQRLIAAGAVSNAGAAVHEARRKVKAGEVYALAVPPAEPAEARGEDIPLTIVYEDADVIVIDKPAGLVVHPAAGHATGTLVNALIAHCGASLSGIGGVKRPGIVHRLDKDTSGLLVVAKTDTAHAGLSEQFKSHGADGRLQRLYRALVWGVPDRSAGRIEVPLARSAANRTKIAVALPGGGRHAVTRYKVIETFGEGSERSASRIASLLELELETGRTHQIRVHLAHIGHPVLGDPVYGAGFKTRSGRLAKAAQEALDTLKRQALHAAFLSFEHPRTGRKLSFESKMPEDFQSLTVALRGSGSPPPAIEPGGSKPRKSRPKK